jgi:hypothetical protein
LSQIEDLADKSTHNWQGKAHVRGPQHVRMTEAPPTGYVVLALVRNAWDRATSLANAYAMGNIEWLCHGKITKRTHFCEPQVRWFERAKGAEVRIIRMENIERDFFEFCSDRGIPFEGEFPHLNRRPKERDWKAYYKKDPMLASMVMTRYKEDVERFGQSY